MISFQKLRSVLASSFMLLRSRFAGIKKANWENRKAVLVSDAKV